MLKGALTLLVAVLVSIFSWVAMRTDIVKSAIYLPALLFLHLAVLWTWSCWRCLRSAPSNAHVPPPLSPLLPPFQFRKRERWPGGLGPKPKCLLLSPLGESITEMGIVLTWGMIGRWWAAGVGGSKNKLISSDSLLSPAYRLSRTLKLPRQDFSQVGGSNTLYISNEHKVFSNTSLSTQPAQHFSHQPYRSVRVFFQSAWNWSIQSCLLLGCD